MNAFKIRWDLGVRGLGREFGATFSARDGFRSDAIAAVSVALLAIPLSLAIALASGVPSGTALVSAVVAGMIAALFGGTTLAVTGPAAAMAVLVGTIVESHGLTGLVAVTLLAGLMQLIVGMLGFGSLARLVPLPVVEGFTAGIGLIILVGQLPRALGLAPPPESHVLSVLTHIGELLHETHPLSLLVAAAALVFCVVAPRIHPKLPGPLLAVVVPTLAVAAFDVSITRIGDIPRSFPAPAWPAFSGGIGAYLSPALMVFALGSLESLLSAAAVDKLARTTRHDPDQEFIGQGLANMGSALFGGMPVTSVIARSALNVQAGARTRRSAFMHAVLVLVLVLGAAPYLALIPVAALAGVLMSVSLRMLSPGPLLALYRSARPDAIVYLVTFVAMVVLDLVEGVQWGFGAALLIAAYWSTQKRVQHVRFAAAHLHRLVFEGPLTFLSAMEFERLRKQLDSVAEDDAVVLDLSSVSHADASGAEQVSELAGSLLARRMRVVLLGMRDEVKQRVLANGDARLSVLCVDSEAELTRLMPEAPTLGESRLSLGVASYNSTQRPRYESLFKKLASGQTPHTLFITCADSRVVPNLITNTDPGELFLLRNVGNMVPPFGPRELPATGAGVEYAVGVLGVSDIVLCGHSGCGAIHALRHPQEVGDALPSLHSWLQEASARELCDRLPATLADDDVARLNTLLQLDHLRSYPIVREREAAGTLRLRAWFFDIAGGDVEVFAHEQQRWQSMVTEADESPAPEPARINGSKRADGRASETRERADGRASETKERADGRASETKEPLETAPQGG